MMTTRILPSAGIILALVAAAARPDARAEPPSSHPVVVELFTSQGCSSCPPADAFMSDLALRDDVIALTLPIDYWDNYGWHDTFASPAHSERQRGYAGRLPNRRVYTPQMVVNGRHDVIGSHRDEVAALIRREANRTHSETVAVNVTVDGETLTVTLGDMPDRIGDLAADVWIAPFHAGAQSVAIGAGENKGRTVDYSNVVRGLKKLGTYDGRRVTLSHPMQSMLSDRVSDCAVLVQEASSGPIIGAKRLDLSPGG